MRKILGWAGIFGMLALAWSVSGSAAVTKRARARKGGARAASASSKTSSKKGKKAPARRTTWRNRQMTPSPERYKQIQQALVAKGYLKPEDANGAWNQASTDALKKFQAEQNLDVSGKINSLSLIALGLGPKHDSINASQLP